MEQEEPKEMTFEQMEKAIEVMEKNTNIYLNY
jgi:hypothetical protein